MKIFKKLLIVALVLSLSLGLFACKSNNETVDSETSADTTETIVNTISFLDYAVVRAEKMPEALNKDASDMYIKLTALSGADTGYVTDHSDGTEPDSEAKEILVGHTNRPETEQVISQLSATEYAVAVVGNKIVIAGITENITYLAVEYFVQTYLGDGADGSIPKDTFYRGNADMVCLVDSGEPMYTIVRGKNEINEMLDQLYALNNAIKAAAGVELTLKTDRLNTDESYDDSTAEILFGENAYSQTQACHSTVGFGEYKIGLDGNKIILYAWSADIMKIAVEAFTDMLTFATYEDADGKVTVLIPKSEFEGNYTGQNFYSEVPSKADGRLYDGIYDCEDGALMLYWENASEKMMDDYAVELEKMGYTEHQSLDNNALSSVSYKKDKALVHIYYTKAEKEFRVITEDNAGFAVNPYEYTKVCDVSVTQLCSNSGIGMSYVIRLEDGTFIVIDGGEYDDSAYNRLVNTMKEQLPEGVDKPIITAWFLSHRDSDHCGMIRGCISNHSNDLTVKMFIGNDVPNKPIGGGDSDDKFLYTSVNGKFGGCVYKKAHTGEQFFFPGMTITILYTHEDIYPLAYIGPINNASMVFDGIVEGEMLDNSPADNQTRFVWLGDAQNVAANVMYKMYGDSLKCDILQVAHHGNKNGANLALYSMLNPSVVFWPGLEAERAQYESASNIKYLIDNADKFYFHDMDKGNATITFPERLTFDNIVGDYGEEGTYIKNY